MINRPTKQAGIVLILTLLFNLFSLPIYASDTIERAGGIIQIVLPVVAGSTALYKKDHEGVVQFSKSFLTTLGVTGMLKYTVDAERPNGGSHSFPSGHTAAAFSGASFLQKRYGWHYGIPAYAAASFVGYSRIESNNHYSRDVFAAAAIGVVSTYLFTDAYKKGIVVTPIVGDKLYGIQLSATF